MNKLLCLNGRHVYIAAVRPSWRDARINFHYQNIICVFPCHLFSISSDNTSHFVWVLAHSNNPSSPKPVLPMLRCPPLPCCPICIWSIYLISPPPPPLCMCRTCLCKASCAGQTCMVQRWQRWEREKFISHSMRRDSIVGNIEWGRKHRNKADFKRNIS